MAFVNYSNHTSSAWSSEQLAAAREYGDIIDIQFTQVNAEASEEDIQQMAEESMVQIMSYNPTAVLVQGEFTLTYRVVTMLLEKGIKVLAACAERRTEEWTEPDGSHVKKAVFRFVKFREYR